MHTKFAQHLLVMRMLWGCTVIDISTKLGVHVAIVKSNEHAVKGVFVRLGIAFFLFTVLQ
jgi:hypothetical protein